MTYELAKELENAGFPMPSDDYEYLFTAYNQTYTHYINVPTLSELIEACGKAWFTLQYITTDDEGWTAGKYRGKEHVSVGYCSTPEEAVARLYLALKKQS